MQCNVGLIVSTGSDENGDCSFPFAAIDGHGSNQPTPQTPMFIASMQPASEQATNYYQQGLQYLIPFFSGALVGWFGHLFARRCEDSSRIWSARERFHDVTAEMRAKREEWKDKPEKFIEQSVPVLRRAVYRVERFAKDWPRLQAEWKKYVARDKKNGQLTAFCCLVDDTRALHGEGKSAFDIHLDYLKLFDDYVLTIRCSPRRLPLEFRDELSYTTVIEPAEPLARRRGSLDRSFRKNG